MQTNAIPRQLSGHNGAIYDSCWDNFRHEWLTAGGDGVVAAWGEMEDPNGRACFQSEHAFYAVEALEAGPIAGTEAGELMLLDASGAPRKITAHDQGIFSLTPIGVNEFYCGGGDARITRWEGLSMTGEWHWNGATKIRVIRPSKAGILVGSSSGGGMIAPSLSGPLDFAKAISIEGHEGGLYDAVFLPQKAVWLTGGRDGHIRVWSTEGKALLATPAHEAAIYRIAVHGNLVYTASRDKTVKSWNVGDLSFVSKWSHMNGGAKRSVNALTIGGTNQDQLLSAGDDRMIRILPINA